MNTTNKVWLFSGLGMIGLAFFKHCLAFYCNFHLAALLDS